MPIKDYEVIDIETNQPRWRHTWFTKNQMHKLHYINAPQDLRIDPTFCPIQRRRDWDTFKMISIGEGLNWLNYPHLQAPEPNKKPTEQYVITSMKNVISRLEGVPDLSCMMLTKIANMIITIITAFNDLSQAGPHWSTYFEGPNGLAWNLSDAPPKEILMGLYARCIFLPAHWMVTFEECFYTGFFEIDSQIFSMINKDPRSRYVAYMTMEKEHPVRDVLAEVELQQRMQRFRAALDRR